MISFAKKIIWILIVVMLPSGIVAQSFGKNKVQYHDYKWVFLKSQHFDIYFYEGGQYIAEFAAEVLEKALDRYQKDFDYNIRKRIPLILYKSHNDFQYQLLE